MAHKILSVGQCGADDYGLKLALRGEFDAEVKACDTAEQALAALRGGGYDLTLVNRVFDRDGDSGLALIRRIKQDAALAAVPVMLVSNYPQSQAEAVAAGALPGFGKSELGAAAFTERVGRALATKQEGPAGEGVPPAGPRGAGHTN